MTTLPDAWMAAGVTAVIALFTFAANWGATRRALNGLKDLPQRFSALETQCSIWADQMVENRHEISAVREMVYEIRGNCRAHIGETTNPGRRI